MELEEKFKTELAKIHRANEIISEMQVLEKEIQSLGFDIEFHGLPLKILKKI